MQCAPMNPDPPVTRTSRSGMGSSVIDAAHTLRTDYRSGRSSGTTPRPPAATVAAAGPATAADRPSSDRRAPLAGDLELGHLQPRDLELVDGQALDARPPDGQTSDRHRADRERADRDGRHRGRAAQSPPADVGAGQTERETLDDLALPALAHDDSVAGASAIAQVDFAAATATGRPRTARLHCIGKP